MTIGEIVSLPFDCLPQLESLLAANGLPADDCAEQADIFYGIFDDGRLIAAGGLETAGDYALLRSIVVHPDYRGRRLARALCDFLLQRARGQEKIAVYLLTESAAGYFEKAGFVHQSRTQVPAEIAETRQFAALCPESASCLKLDLAAA